jgi:hypothetical protein
MKVIKDFITRDVTMSPYYEGVVMSVPVGDARLL